MATYILVQVLTKPSPFTSEKKQNIIKSEKHRSSVFVSGTQQIKSIPPLLFHTWKIPPLSAKEIQHQKFRTRIFGITN